MAKELWSGDQSRRITTRIVVEGDLVLQTPAHFGNGDGDDLTDMPLLLDPFAEAQGKVRPLLTGATIAGALRAYLRSVEHGYGTPIPSRKKSASALLFGGVKEDPEGEQSPLIVDDALGVEGTFGIEMREGVKLSPASRTAEEDKLFDLHLWRAGTRFQLRFELLIRQKDDDPDYADELKQALATALAGFNDGSVTLGARKRRGYGQAQVDEWRVTSFDLEQVDGLLAWIVVGRSDLNVTTPQPQKGRDLSVLLKVKPLEDAREGFTIDAAFALDGSLLIRSGSGQEDQGPDAVHLHSVRADSQRDEQGRLIPDPVLSGTSLGGALRARALRIAQTIARDERGRRIAWQIVEDMFGADSLKKLRVQGIKPFASRLSVKESGVKSGSSLVQSRIRIDRFTGGAFETALFSEQPVFSDGKQQALTISVKLRKSGGYAIDNEIGLLLLVLKDLWTSDLPLGGASSVGRGRLRGIQADLRLRLDGESIDWKLEQPTLDGAVVVTGTGTRKRLEEFVSALHTRLGAPGEQR